MAGRPCSPNCPIRFLGHFWTKAESAACPPERGNYHEQGKTARRENNNTKWMTWTGLSRLCLSFPCHSVCIPIWTGAHATHCPLECQCPGALRTTPCYHAVYQVRHHARRLQPVSNSSLPQKQAMEMGRCTLTPSLKVKTLGPRYACMYEGSSPILLRAPGLRSMCMRSQRCELRNSLHCSSTRADEVVIHSINV